MEIKINMCKQNIYQYLSKVSVIALMMQLSVPFLVPAANAGIFSKNLVRFDRMAINQTSTGLVCFAPTVTTAISSVQVIFPTGYLTSTTLANWTVGLTTTGWPSGALALTGVGTATAVSAATAGTVTFPVSAAFTPVAGTLYCFNWTTAAALTQPSGTGTSEVGSVITRDSVPSNIDSANYSTATVGATADQINVTATVNQSFSFSLASNAAALGTLSTSAPTSAAAINAQLSTNAKNGWQMWAKDLGGTVGLRSASAPYTIAYSPAVATASAALSNGVEGFNLGVGTPSQTSGGGTMTRDANFTDGASVASQGGGLDNTLRSLITSTGTANAAIVPLKINASISSITPAATDYAATLVIVAAGNF